MADYTVSTNAKRENALTRAASEAGATKTQAAQAMLNEALDRIASIHSQADQAAFWELARASTGAARQSALAALAAAVAQPSVNAVGNQSHAVGAPVQLQVVATDPTDNLNLKYAATGLPPGMTMGQDSGGVIAGTPTTAGVYNVTVRVTKLLGVFTEVSFTWTITA